MSLNLHTDIKSRCLKANLNIRSNNLAVFTFGNVSLIDREKKIIAIKPSGVPYIVPQRGFYIKIKPQQVINQHVEVFCWWSHLHSKGGCIYTDNQQVNLYRWFGIRTIVVSVPNLFKNQDFFTLTLVRVPFGPFLFC